MIRVAEKYDAVVPMLNRPESLYAIYKKSILETLEKSIGQKVYSLQKLIHLQIGTIRIFQNPEYSIYEETQAYSDKDTSRMLQAGASNVYFIEADREYVYPAFQKLSEIIPVNAAIICESGTSRKYIKPSLFILVNTIGTMPKESAKDIMQMADKIFNFEFGNLQIPYKSQDSIVKQNKI